MATRKPVIAAEKRRGLGAVRLSHMTDATTSPDTQVETIRKEERDDIEIVLWAKDLDISAADYPPQDRPELGPYLRDPELIATYDVIIWAKLDRAIRSVVDLYWLLEFAKKHGKELIFAKDKLDTTTSVGRIVATLLAAVGEIEIANMVERRQRASAFLRATARWPGGPAPYGYVAVDNADGGGKVLEIAPDEQAIALEIIQRATDDEPLAEIAEDLSERSIPTSRTRAKPNARNRLEVKGWTGAVLGRMLRSRALLGQKEQQVIGPDGKATGERKLLLDGKGQPIQAAPPLISLEQWRRLQAALDRGSRPQPRGKFPNPLAGVLLCGACENPLRKHGSHKRPEHTHKFRCYKKGCGKTSQYVEFVWAALEDAFLSKMGDKRVLHRRYVPGEDHSAELDDVKLRIKALRDARYIKGEFEGEEGEWDSLMLALREQRERLESLPQRKGGWAWIEGDETYADQWSRLSREQKGYELKRAGLTVELFPVAGAEMHLDINLPDGMQQLLAVTG